MAEAVSFDFETTGLNPHRGARAFSYSLGYPDGSVEVCRMNTANRRKLIRFFEDTSIPKVLHNAKFDLSFLPYHGISIPPENTIHDTLVMAVILKNLSPSHSLDYWAWELCGYDRELDKAVKKAGKSLGGFQHIDVDIMNEYQKHDAIRTQLLFKLWYPEVRSNRDMYSDYKEEIKLLITTMRMESRGIRISRKNCNKLITDLQSELDNIQEEIYELFDEYININSNIQVARILYKKLGLPVLKKTATGASVDGDTILELRNKIKHPVLDLILKQRSYTKGLAMIGSYLELADNQGILHPTINTNGAKATRRESSENPNLQNVSKSKNLKNPYPVPARKCFRARPGYVLLLVDYAGIEMRLIVDAAGQSELIKIINSGGDIHEPAAIEFYQDKYLKEKDPSKKKLIRNQAKNAHFALGYGAGAPKLSNVLMLNLEETQAGLIRYKEKYPEVAGFSRNQIKQVKENGYVVTPLGAKLYVKKSEAYRGANYIIQGYASQILKRAQNKVDRFLLKNYPDIHLLLPIHDELMIEYPRKRLQERKKILKEISDLMTNIKGVNVRLDVEWKISTTTWDKAKDYNYEET